MRRIEFKSVKKYFRKEMFGLKTNTIRESDGGVRFELLNDFYKGRINQLNIIIKSVENPDESFEREVTDVSRFKKFYIISWRTK